MERSAGLEVRAARAREWSFLAASALLFVACAAATVRGGAMAGGMRMPGGWTLSMTWMRMPGRPWLAAAASFLWAWLVMMVAMMLPSLVATLRRYRRYVADERRASADGPTLLVAAGYFVVWVAVGALAYPAGLALAAAEMRSPALARAVPWAAGIALLLAAGIQLTSWKARQLERCRREPACWTSPALAARDAWSHGLRMGWHCVLCCSGYMLTLFVVGVMDLRAMAAVALAITVERLAPRPRLVARAAGFVVLTVGAMVLARALRVG